MKNLLLLLVISSFTFSNINAQENNSEKNDYILTEIWKAKPEWYELSKEERIDFFENKIRPVLMNTMKNGAEIVGTAVNNNTGNERINYQFMAVWKFPDKKSSDELESAAKEAGFLKYFDQVNFSGQIVAPPALNQEMIELAKDKE